MDRRAARAKSAAKVTARAATPAPPARSAQLPSAPPAPPRRASAKPSSDLLVFLPAERAQVEATLLRSLPERLPRDKLDLLFMEYSRFLALKLAVDPAPVTPCKAVDSVWHAHLICTRVRLRTALARAKSLTKSPHWIQEYEAFCARCNGGKMVHHEPGIGSEETYGETLHRYELLFNEAPPRSIWGRAKVPSTVEVPPSTHFCGVA
jgi:hypothetical protein